jgi:hypothetical protein
LRAALRELVQQARLAAARLRLDEHHAALAADGAVHLGAQRRQFRSPADEGRLGQGAPRVVRADNQRGLALSGVELPGDLVDVGECPLG